MRVFGLTGGIASGKSSVAQQIRAQGIAVVDADALAREVVARGTEGFDAVVSAFGVEMIGPDGELDRKKLGAHVFANPAARKVLNAIVHPRISAMSAERLQSLAAEGRDLVCYEAALLVENGLADAFRPLVVVAVSLPIQVRRLMKRDGISRDDALARINAQLPLAEKVVTADHVIRNDGTINDLNVQTWGVIDAIRAQP
ncbi:MAG: dephospho-CoA kinase [Polyangiaceae bacterium]